VVGRQSHERAIAPREQFPVEAARIIALPVRTILGEFARDPARPRQMRAWRPTTHRTARRPPHAAHGLEERAVRADRHR
jgi:hypothetical protein